MRSGVIYLITCKLCGHEYIGETGRPLCSRIKEHMDGMRKSKVSTPLGTHRMLQHNGTEFDITVSILSREAEVAGRKTLEACWILSRNPQMNRKDECTAITNELAPFLELCGFDPQPQQPGNLAHQSFIRSSVVDRDPHSAKSQVGLLILGSIVSVSSQLLSVPCI